MKRDARPTTQRSIDPNGPPPPSQGNGSPPRRLREARPLTSSRAPPAVDPRSNFHQGESPDDTLETGGNHLRTPEIDGPAYQAAVLPLGATEPHNLHLPYGTDTFQVEAVACRACEIATERGARVFQLPAIPYGTETNQMEFPMAMNLNPSTLAKVIADLVDSLAKHKIHKLLLLNGHGGNDLKWVLRELHQINACAPVPLQLVQGGGRRLRNDLREAGRPRRRDGDQHGPRPFPRAGEPVGGRRRRGAAEPVRRRQPRLGRTHPPLAPADHQLGLGRSPRRHRRKRRGGHPPRRRTDRPASSPNSPRPRSTPTFHFKLTFRPRIENWKWT